MIRDMKKIELHLHLDGSVDIDTAASLLEQNVSYTTSKPTANVNLDTPIVNDITTSFDWPIIE